MRRTLNDFCLVGLLFAATFLPSAMARVAAQETAPGAAPEIARPAAPQIEMKPPRASSVAVDWPAARAALADISPLLAQDGADAANNDPLVRLNEATQKIFPNIGASSVPVLLPFDTASFLSDQAAGAAADKSKYLSGFSTASFFFFPGPAGYDASLTLQPPGSSSPDVSLRKRIDVQISGSAVIYDLDGPALPEGSPVPELEAQFPAIRRLTLEDHLHYTFVRFGVPYVVTIMCHRMKCRNADKIAIPILKALAIVGGAPQSAPPPPQTIDRPEKASAAFTYYAPGDILPGTGMHGQSGRADATVFAKIRFPMAQAPAYVNSQTFMNWGDCDFTGRVALGGSGKDAAYRCRVNSIPLVRDESKNYAYPWRDNFCEHRYFAVSQCPAGLGHQGEDIRPGSCKLPNAQAARCVPYQDSIVAVRDGMVLRAPGDEALYLVVNAPGEHIRLRYLHMNPALLDAAGMVSGRLLSAGEVIGAADDYERYQGGTTYHLHFDLQVPTRDGWVYVNPYMTLVAAYERLIGARGTLVNDTMIAAAPAGTAPTLDGHAVSPPISDSGQGAPNSAAIAASNPSERPATGAPRGIVAEVDHRPLAEAGKNIRERRARRAEHCQTRLLKGHRRQHCRFDVAESRQRGKPAHAVRSVGRRLSRQGDRARHPGGDLHARHAHRASRHGRA